MNITPEIFLQQCKPRFGTTNPERMRLACWEWMVRTRKDPFVVRKELGLANNYPSCGDDTCSEHEPDWCFDRFGMSKTAMPDGRIICIGGEHEDWYDPDFCIYNDVIVLRPGADRSEITLDSGSVEIFGYPASVFPPTDFHAAALVGRKIFVIGCLGYQDARRPGETPVFSLDTDTYRIEPVSTTGACPGWIFKHHASYNPHHHAITVRSGELCTNNKDLIANTSVHRLDLTTMEWELVTARERQRKYMLEPSLHCKALSDGATEVFRPKRVAHRWLGDSDCGCWLYEIDVEGVRVRFEDCFRAVHTHVEGELSPEIEYDLLTDIAQNLEEHTGVRWDIREVEASES